MIIFGAIILAIIILTLLVYFVFYPKYITNDDTLIVTTVETGPRQIHELKPLPEGYAGFVTYTMALKINKWGFIKDNVKQEIFIHGVSTFNDMRLPGDVISFALDNVNNNLIFKVTTKEINSSLLYVEEFIIDYIPIGKFFHLSIVSGKKRIDVFINCKLYKTYVLEHERNLGIEGKSKIRFLNLNPETGLTNGVPVTYTNVRYILTDANIPYLKSICKSDSIDDDDGKKNIGESENQYFDASNYQLGCHTGTVDNSKENLATLLNNQNTSNFRDRMSLLRTDVLGSGTEILQSLPATPSQYNNFFRNRKRFS